MAERITSAQVAALAGVSQSAVSRVFTPGASVSPRTAEKVRAAADQLGYRPNVLARAMITGRSRMIGLVVAYLDNQFYPVALERLSRALQARGYHALIFMADNDAARTAEVVRELLDYQVDGIVTASVAMSNDLTTRCEAAGIPVVAFNRGQDDPRLSEVTSDNRSGGRKVAEFLVQGGHRRIAHIAGWQGSSTGRDRARGFHRGPRRRRPRGAGRGGRLLRPRHRGTGRAGPDAKARPAGRDLRRQRPHGLRCPGHAPRRARPARPRGRVRRRL
jgi:DNA-binding LacI/PurR family transcriptional regulator